MLSLLAIIFPAAVATETWVAGATASPKSPPPWLFSVTWLTDRPRTPWARRRGNRQPSMRNAFSLKIDARGRDSPVLVPRVFSPDRSGRHRPCGDLIVERRFSSTSRRCSAVGDRRRLRFDVEWIDLAHVVGVNPDVLARRRRREVRCSVATLALMSTPSRAKGRSRRAFSMVVSTSVDLMGRRQGPEFRPGRSSAVPSLSMSTVCWARRRRRRSGVDHRPGVGRVRLW